MSWTCPTCGYNNHDSIAICSCGFEYDPNNPASLTQFQPTSFKEPSNLEITPWKSSKEYRTEEYLKHLPPTSNCPCFFCKKKGKALKFRRLRLSYGYLYWIRTHVWTGYICNSCAAIVTFGCPFVGCISFLLLHPQAFFWIPVRLIQNLWNTFAGFLPEGPMAIKRSELIEGMLDPKAAKRISEIIAKAAKV